MRARVLVLVGLVAVSALVAFSGLGGHPGQRVLFIGDGESDRYAGGYSDIVFAKRSLERICLEAGWPFHRWTAFSEIEAWLAEQLAAWAADPATLTPVPPGEPPPHGFFCGPEAWGEGQVDPPPGSWPPPRG